MKYSQYLLIVGNPVDGVTMYGPFVEAKEATEYAELEFKNEDWWVTELEEPKGTVLR